MKKRKFSRSELVSVRTRQHCNLGHFHGECPAGHSYHPSRRRSSVSCSSFGNLAKLSNDEKLSNYDKSSKFSSNGQLSGTKIQAHGGMLINDIKQLPLDEKSKILNVINRDRNLRSKDTGRLFQIERVQVALSQLSLDEKDGLESETDDLELIDKGMNGKRYRAFEGEQRTSFTERSLKTCFRGGGKKHRFQTHFTLNQLWRDLQR